ncbi:MAG: hypothetical protein OJJ54_09010 [Pseudonocardia sp.]|nr:hypothetical protein [Pseudonocardia sp.]
MPNRGGGFTGAEAALRAACPEPDAVVVALDGAASSPGPGPEWRQVLDDHADVTGRVLAHAGWLTAALRLPGPPPARIVHVVAAETPGGRTTAQAVTQSARSANGAESVRSAVFTVSAESGTPARRRHYCGMQAARGGPERERGAAESRGGKESALLHGGTSVPLR